MSYCRFKRIHEILRSAVQNSSLKKKKTLTAEYVKIFFFTFVNVSVLLETTQCHAPRCILSVFVQIRGGIPLRRYWFV